MAIVSFTSTVEHPNYIQKAMEMYRKDLERQYQTVYHNQLAYKYKYQNQETAQSQIFQSKESLNDKFPINSRSSKFLPNLHPVLSS